jgi:hypothetical protein
MPSAHSRKSAKLGIERCSRIRAWRSSVHGMRASRRFMGEVMGNHRMRAARPWRLAAAVGNSPRRRA